MSHRTEPTILKKDYCSCDTPLVCGFGPGFCSLGCGKVIKKTISQLRDLVKARKSLESIEFIDDIRNSKSLK